MRLCVAAHEAEIERLKAEIKAKAEDEIFRGYVADALKTIEQNTAKSVGGSAHANTYGKIINLFRHPEAQSYETAEQTVERFTHLFGKEVEEE